MTVVGWVTSVFDALVIPVTMKELIRDGFLVPFTMIRPDHQLENNEIAAKPVDAYLAHAAGRQAIAFALHIKAATEFCDQFKDAGIASELVTGTTPGGERAAILNRYKDGTTRVLWNVGIATEGFDHRPTSCVILARNIGPLALYLQCLGRALRCSPGKTDAVLVDLQGSSWSHGKPDDDREWTLEGDGKNKTVLPPIAERFCAVCGVLVEMDAAVCPGCGIAKPELTTPEVVNVRLVKFAAKIAEGPEKRAATLARWIDDAVKAGHKPGKAAFKFKGTYGAFPTAEIQRLAAAIRRQSTSAID